MARYLEHCRQPFDIICDVFPPKPQRTHSLKQIKWKQKQENQSKQAMIWKLQLSDNARFSTISSLSLKSMIFRWLWLSNQGQTQTFCATFCTVGSKIKIFLFQNNILLIKISQYTTKTLACMSSIDCSKFQILDYWTYQIVKNPYICSTKISQCFQFLNFRHPVPIFSIFNYQKQFNKCALVFFYLFEPFLYHMVFWYKILNRTI